MVYLACQHAIKMVVMWYDRVVSSFERMQLKQNQHSLYDIYVHGELYPTHACLQC